MAEERNVGLARATDTTLDAPATGTATSDESSTKEDLQRRMEQARESITQTVSEIKDTVATQYQSVVESLDWREQYKRRPVALSLGAVGVGLLVGYGVTSMFKGDGRDDDDYDYEEMDTDGYDYDVPATYGGQAVSSPPARSLGAMQTRSYAAAPAAMAAPSSSSASQQSYADTTEQKDDSPGLLERFKGTTAYDRLMQEVSTLGGRAVDELSNTAQNVVLPMLLSKVKDMVGIDLNTQKKQAERSKLESQTSQAHAAGVRSSQETAERQQDAAQDS